MSSTISDGMKNERCESTSTNGILCPYQYPLI